MSHLDWITLENVYAFGANLYTFKCFERPPICLTQHQQVNVKHYGVMTVAELARIPFKTSLKILQDDFLTTIYSYGAAKYTDRALNYPFNSNPAKFQHY